MKVYEVKFRSLGLSGDVRYYAAKTMRDACAWAHKDLNAEWRVEEIREIGDLDKEVKMGKMVEVAA